MDRTGFFNTRVVRRALMDALLAEGVYVIGFSYPVVPKGKARLRTQMSAAHTPAQIERIEAMQRFTEAIQRKRLHVILEVWARERAIAGVGLCERAELRR